VLRIARDTAAPEAESLCRVASIFEFVVISTPGVTTTLLVPAAIGAIPQVLNSARPRTERPSEPGAPAWASKRPPEPVGA